MSARLENVLCQILQATKNIIVGEKVCLSVDGKLFFGQAVSSVDTQNNTSSFMGWLNPLTGTFFSGDVVVNEDQCACSCNNENVKSCIMLRAWDIMPLENLDPREMQELNIYVNGNLVSTTLQNYLNGNDGVTKNSWYPEWISALNNIQGLTFTEASPTAGVNDDEKAAWKIEYEGPYPIEIKFTNGTPGNAANQDAYVLAVDSEGNLTTETMEYNQPGQPFGTDPFSDCQ